MRGARLLLFARRARLGHVKTRLVPPLTPEEALALHLAFVEDQVGLLLRLRGDGAEVEVWTDGPWRPKGALAEVLGGVLVQDQGPGDLGERMLRAFVRSREKGVRATLVLGADAPTIPEQYVLEALAALKRGAAAGLCPAEDGGYVLLAMREPVEALFRGIPWGGSGVLEATRLRAREAGIELFETSPWYDVDDAAGLERLRRDPGLAVRAPATERVLASLDLREQRVL